MTWTKLYIGTICCFISFSVLSQSTDCYFDNATDSDSIFSGEIFFNYGSVTNTVNSKSSITASLGEMFIGSYFGQEYQGTAGFYGKFLLPPSPPIITATQGDVLDRIQLNWSQDPLSPSASGGFNIYRDGIFLANVGPEVSTYNDFNVIAGENYTYEIRGINTFGEGSPGEALGFQVPNGVVTGWVRTPSGNPVPDALIQLTPMQGFSSQFQLEDRAQADTTDTDFTSFIPTPGDPWSISFWMQTDTAIGNGGIIELSPSPVQFRPVTSSGGKDGIILFADGPTNLRLNFPDSTRNEWHHILTSYDGSNYRMYVDGVFEKIGTGIEIQEVTALKFGDEINRSGQWAGRLDELRIYDRVLDELDLEQIMMGTASSLTPNLKHYWKFDEGQGEKSFDIINRTRLKFCGPTFSENRPPVKTSAVTNAEGYYRIESASYGTGTTFLAAASKNFYSQRALKFNASENDYALLPDFGLPQLSTIEFWFNNQGSNSNSMLLKKSGLGANNLFVFTNDIGNGPQLFVFIDGQLVTSTIVSDKEYQHIALAIINSGFNKQIGLYLNGQLVGQGSASGVVGDFSNPNSPWSIGADVVGNSVTLPYDGFISEIAIYNEILPIESIQGNYNNGRSAQDSGLLYYFPFNEGSGVNLTNIGSALTPQGEVFGAEWSPFAPNQETTPHEFTPEIRQVTLNPSVTSVDQVDFVDRSVIPVTGYVRYANTDCFAKNVEILVNGASYITPIFTDSTGKFTVDFDPSSSFTLSPLLADHQFIPATKEIVNLTNPITGLLFSDITSREVSGQVAGGECMLPIIENPGTTQGTVCIVKIASSDGCYERQMTLDNEAGNFSFAGVPPLESVTLSVIEHSDPAIKSAFQVEGGSTLNLVSTDTMVNFIYFAPPEVEVSSGLEPFSMNCEAIVLEQDEIETVELRLFENYVPGGKCFLDTASFSIINGISEVDLDTVMSGGMLEYTFTIGTPNPSPPYLKSIQFIGTAINGQKGSISKQAVVTGIRNKENTFTTQMPETPILILRDPPGDQSYSYWEKENKACVTSKFFLETEDGTGTDDIVNNGPKVKITLPVGGPIIETETTLGVEFNGNLSYKKITDNSIETCVSTSERIQTASGENTIGSDADVYVGFGTNLSVGFADVVSFNDTFCEPRISQLINVEPLSATNFMYSEKHIKDNVIRYLEDITSINPPPENVDSTTLAEYEVSAQRWKDIITLNDSLKGEGMFIKNISYDAGVSYEYAENSTEYISNSESEFANGKSKIKTFTGFSQNGLGFNLSLNVNTSVSRGVDFDINSNTTGIKTGYHLGDNDAGDAFTLDIAMDSVYKTPVFKLIAGQSTCPWEPGTANREAPNLQIGEGFTFEAVNVPAHEAAVFQINLGNLSATNEDMYYGLNVNPASNPDGAVIKVNGSVLNSTQPYVIPFGTSVPVTLTIERGPLAYEYDSLEIALFSECEYERNLAAGNTLSNDTTFYSPLYLGVDFIRPCSEVDINVPEQNWVKTNNDPDGSGSIRRITVSGYDLSNEDFKLIRVQYRKTFGDGAWINIQDTSDRYNPNWSGFEGVQGTVGVLGPTFTQFQWETSLLSDDDYEIHAWAVCDGDAADQPGFSDIIKGRIEREPPYVIGKPHPSDASYGIGDEISFTFNKNINCEGLIQADEAQSNNYGLYVASTNELIDVSLGCFENKITLTPSPINNIHENKLLRAELHDIEDLVGNSMVFEKWEFYLDQNELAWMTDSLGVVKVEGEQKTAVAKIHNRAGYPVPFELIDLPEWIHAVPDEGTLVPNEIREVTFHIDQDLPFGLWSDTLKLKTGSGANPFTIGGIEDLPIGVRVICEAPNWTFDPGQFETSMNLIARLNIDGNFSVDPEDILYASINDNIVGMAHVRHIPETNQHLLYLTIYGNPELIGETVTFSIWDASSCRLYGEILESITFIPDDIIGSTGTPQVLNTSGNILKEVAVAPGWNWMSINLEYSNASTNEVLDKMKNPDGDLIKSQFSFSENLGGQWFGSLLSISDTTMYKYRSSLTDTIKVHGIPIDPLSKTYSVYSGWNWIGYTPDYPLTLNIALSSLANVQSGDIVRSQNAFAEYVDSNIGWVGNLNLMKPLEGYQILLANNGQISFPANPNGFMNSTLYAQKRSGAQGYWDIDPMAFQHSFTMIGYLNQDDQNGSSQDMEVGIFMNDELRGTGKAIYIEPLDEYLFFITVYAYKDGEEMHFKLYSNSTNEVSALKNKITFASNQHLGSITSPIPLYLDVSTSLEEATYSSFSLYPNPTSSDITVVFEDQQNLGTGSIEIFNTNGKKIIHRKLEKVHKQISFDLKDHPSGIYIVRLSSGNQKWTRRFIKLK